MTTKATGIANTGSTRSIGTIVSISCPPKRTPATVDAFLSRGNRWRKNVSPGTQTMPISLRPLKRALRAVRMFCSCCSRCPRELW
jgi:hypothetical protein